jgi:hypothetical protein
MRNPHIQPDGCRFAAVRNRTVYISLASSLRPPLQQSANAANRPQALCCLQAAPDVRLD